MASPWSRDGARRYANRDVTRSPPVCIPLSDESVKTIAPKGCRHTSSCRQVRPVHRLEIDDGGGWPARSLADVACLHASRGKGAGNGSGPGRA